MKIKRVILVWKSGVVVVLRNCFEESSLYVDLVLTLHVNLVSLQKVGLYSSSLESRGSVHGISDQIPLEGLTSETSVVNKKTKKNVSSIRFVNFLSQNASHLKLPHRVRKECIFRGVGESGVQIGSVRRCRTPNGRLSLLS